MGATVDFVKSRYSQTADTLIAEYDTHHRSEILVDNVKPELIDRQLSGVVASPEDANLCSAERCGRCRAVTTMLRSMSTVICHLLILSTLQKKR